MKKQWRRLTAGKGVTLAVLLVAALVIVGSVAWEAKLRLTRIAFSLSLLGEAVRIYPQDPARAQALLASAAGALHVSIPPGGFSSQVQGLDSAAVHRLSQLAADAWPLAVPWLMVGLVAAVVLLYWLKENSIERLAEERQRLRAELLAITASWGAIPHHLETDAMITHILRQLCEHTAIATAAVFRFASAGGDGDLSLYAHVGTLPRRLYEETIPRVFLQARFGLLGQCLEDHRPVYSGDGGEAGDIVPGVRLARAGLYPVSDQNRIWGVVLLQGDEPGWFTRYRDLMDVMVQGIAVLVQNAQLAAEARDTAMFQEMARVRSEILANVSHEFRTPLGLIKGYVETLKTAQDRLPAEEKREFLDVVAEETDQLEHLIDNLLYMSRLETVGVQLERQWFDAQEWIERLTRRYPPPASARIAAFVPSGLAIYGDARQLGTVMDNLIHNGLKYSQHEVKVFVDAHPGLIRIRVADRGPGVPSEELGQIFERFYRSPRHAHSEIRGSGLGLSIARRVIEAHTGRITADNRPEGGLVITIELPLPDEGQNQHPGHEFVFSRAGQSKRHPGPSCPFS